MEKRNKDFENRGSNSLQLLRLNIALLEKNIQTKEKEHSFMRSVGIANFSQALQLFGRWPIYTFLAIEIILSIVLGNGNIPVWIGALSLRASTALALYCSIPLAGLLFCLSIISIRYHKANEKEMANLAAEIQNLKEELAKREEQADEMEKDIASGKDLEDSSYERSEIREYTIRTLQMFKTQLLENRRAGTLPEYLRRLGVPEEGVDCCSEFIAKHLLLEEKEKNKNS